jgi:cytoskeleton-associated protein 5
MADEDFEKLPLPDKLSHKVWLRCHVTKILNIGLTLLFQNWKARNLGYQELKSLFIKYSDEPENKDAPYGKYHDNIKGLATESNVVALEGGLDALYAYVENAPDAARYGNTCLNFDAANRHLEDEYSLLFH